jgi:hypothetical protein
MLLPQGKLCLLQYILKASVLEVDVEWCRVVKEGFGGTHHLRQVGCGSLCFSNG